MTQDQCLLHDGSVCWARRLKVTPVTAPPEAVRQRAALEREVARDRQEVADLEREWLRLTRERALLEGPRRLNVRPEHYERLAIHERVLLWIHILSCYPESPFREDWEVGTAEGLSQDEVGRAAGVARAHAALVLGKLVVAGLLEARKGYVAGRPISVLTYCLTGKGREFVRPLVAALQQGQLPSKILSLGSETRFMVTREALRRIRAAPKARRPRRAFAPG